MNILRQVLVIIHRFKVAWVKSRRFENVLGHNFTQKWPIEPSKTTNSLIRSTRADVVDKRAHNFIARALYRIPLIAIIRNWRVVTKMPNFAT